MGLTRGWCWNNEFVYFRTHEIASEMHKNCYRLALRPRPRWESFRCSPRLSSRLGRVHPSQTLHHRRLRVSIFGTRLSTFGVSIVLPYQIFNPGAASAPYYVPPTVQRDRRHMFIWYRNVTDRRTDGQTDRQTELLYQYRASVCWRAIKTYLVHANQPVQSSDWLWTQQPEV